MPFSNVLVVVGRPWLGVDEWSRLRELAAGGATLVAWQHPAIVQDRFPSPDVAAALEREGLEAATPSEVLGEGLDAEVDDAVIGWMKAFGRTPLSPAGSFRDLFRHRHLSLWWWAELFLYHDTRLRLLVRDVEVLARLIEKREPDRVVLVGPVRDLARAAARLAESVEVVGESERGESRRRRLGTSLRYAGAYLKMMGTGLKALFRALPGVPGRRMDGCQILFLTHASMWRKRRDPASGREELVEMYFDEVIPALERAGENVRLVAFGPPVPFKKRGGREWLRDVIELEDRDRPYVSARRYFPLALIPGLFASYLRCGRMWRRFRRLPGLAEALAHRGVPLEHTALESFRETFLLQLPWAIRSYEEMCAVLDRERPDVLVLYAESSGLGRAALAACRARGIPSFAIQHGIMYPRYYSHEHAPHEVGLAADGSDAVPLPTRTAVFGSLARDLLVTRGHYPPERLVVTGSPKFDGLVEVARRYDRVEIRRRLEVDPSRPLLVTASRFSAIGAVFEELVRAVASLPELEILVKPHPAESPEPYARVIGNLGVERVRLISPGENLLELLFASDGLITVDSLASSEALVLGKPVLVVNLPSNLSALVDRRVALGVHRGESIEAQLRRLLFDRGVGRELEARRRSYLQEFASGADGRSTSRIVSAIQELAERGRREATGLGALELEDGARRGASSR